MQISNRSTAMIVPLLTLAAFVSIGSEHSASEAVDISSLSSATADASAGETRVLLAGNTACNPRVTVCEE